MELRKAKIMYNSARKIIADITRPVRKYLEYKIRLNFLLKRSSKDKRRSIIRHEAHRIEKAYYNHVFKKNPKIYEDKAKIINSILREDFGKAPNEPDMLWAKEIAKNFRNLDTTFIDNSKAKSNNHAQRVDCVQEFYLNMAERRSNRTWSEIQPSASELTDLANRLISAAVDMPSSGNRQTSRFLILCGKEETQTLRGLKEAHCFNAPLVIITFTDETLYGSYGTFGKNEDCILIDGAISTTAMMIAAELEGYSTCWNHFGTDLIKSRKSNQVAYKALQKKFRIRPNLRPISALAIGKEKFLHPKPKRMDRKEFQNVS